MDKFDLKYWHISQKGLVNPNWLLTNEMGKKLAHAIDKKLKVEIVYSGGTAPPTKRIIEPYNLFERLGNNYLESYCYLREELRTFRIDRIESIEILNSPHEKYSIYTLKQTPTYTSVLGSSASRGIPGWIWIIGLFLLFYLCSKFKW
jgi:predicted DNA-binding transcriptional regulator YafY